MRKLRRLKKLEKSRDWVIEASFLVALFSYGAFVVLRGYSGQWFWEPYGFMALGTYLIYEAARLFSSNYETPEMIVMKCLLVFNFIPMI